MTKKSLLKKMVAGVLMCGMVAGLTACGAGTGESASADKTFKIGICNYVDMLHLIRLLIT